MIYYTRNDKEGRMLVTSYDNLTRAKAIAAKETNSTGLKFWEGEMFLNLETGKMGKEVDGVGLRSFMKSEVAADNSGRFAIFSFDSNDKPVDVGLRFKNYSDANALMKSLVNSYGKLAIAEVEKQKVVQKDTLDATISDEAPL